MSISNWPNSCQIQDGGRPIFSIVKQLQFRRVQAHSGAPYQRKAGALFSYAKPGFSYLWRCTFFPKKLTTFLVVITFKRTLNVQTSKQIAIKIWQLIGRGPLVTGGPSHGTTGTMDNPALAAYCSISLKVNTVWPRYYLKRSRSQLQTSRSQCHVTYQQ